MPEESLKKKVVGGMAWTGVEKVVSKAVNFAIGIALARMLARAFCPTLVDLLRRAPARPLGRALARLLGGALA